MAYSFCNWIYCISSLRNFLIAFRFTLTGQPEASDSREGATGFLGSRSRRPRTRSARSPRPRGSSIWRMCKRSATELLARIPSRSARAWENQRVVVPWGLVKCVACRRFRQRIM